MSRIAFATYGSAGDLFPIVPVVQHLRALGHDATVLATRSLGLYLRAIGLPAVAVGDGREVEAVSDRGLLGLDRDGWGSWERLARDYLLPTLGPDTDSCTAALEALRPDLVVTTGFAVAARRASRSLGLPWIEASIYPQLQDADAARSSLRRLRETSECGGRGWFDDLDEAILWGSRAAILLHDRALLGPRAPELDPIGYPGGGVAAAAADAQRLTAFVDADDGPVLLATLGSFLGATQESTWAAIVAAARSADLRLAVVGLVDPELGAALDDDPRMVRVGFVPFAEHLPAVDCVLHHGGLGTTFAAVRAGCPMLILPQAFDQASNGALVEAAGLGIVSSVPALAPDLHRLRAMAAAPGPAAALVREADAATRCAELILERCGG